MGILGSILGIGAVSGGLFGLTGNLATKTFSYLEHAASLREKQVEWTHETELLKLQMQTRAPETESDSGADLLATQSLGALNASIADNAAMPTSYPWVNAARALVRPALTLGLAAVLAAAFFAMKPGDAERANVIDSLVFAAVTAIVWWFGDRAPSRLTRR